MSNIQPKIATVAIGIIQAIQTGQTIYTIVANAMDAAESQGSTSGADKKAWVLAYAKSIVFSMGENWEVLEQKISQFINQLKSAYNAVKTLF